MSNRNQVTQILEVRERGQYPLWSVHREFKALSDSWGKRLIKGGRQEPSDDFYVIRSVTLLEVFTRFRIAELIDHGSPYTERGVDIAKSIKIDYDVLRNVQERKITLGDIVAHSVSINAFDQIVSLFERLLLGNLLDALSKFKQPDDSPIIPDVRSFTKALAKVFSLRHILCHELPARSQYQLEDVAPMLEACQHYADATTALIESTVFPERRKTFWESTQDLIQEACNLDVEIQRIVTEVPSDRESRLLWKRSQEAWVKYKDRQCAVRADLTRGGSLSSRLWTEERMRLTSLRYEELKWYSERKYNEFSVPKKK